MILAKSRLQCQPAFHEFLRSSAIHRSFATQKTKEYNLITGIVLNRSPFLTRTPTPFEKAFYNYQARIHRAISNPFPHEFYFKPGSILGKRFREEERRREILAFRPNKADKFGIIEESIEQIEEEEEIERPRSRWTEADEKNDLKSLERKGERNLYLLVKCKPGEKYEWRFPQGYVEEDELLHEAAERDLREQCGSNMNTWIVGRRPIGFFEYQDIDKTTESSSPNKVFFFKGHIFAGEVKAHDDITDFVWLTKEEIEPYVEKDYWLGIKDMLSDF